MRNHSTTGRRRFVVVALLLLAVFALHPACPPEPAHHAAPGISGEVCHHGETHHAAPAAPVQAAVQTTPHSPAAPDAEPPARAVAAASACPLPSPHGSAGRTLLLDLGISRT
ncbi:hypothetical protein [Lentzea sp. NPDC003310]|uniref:hypothetical protein n=1 Tax=Lentzea sp. NPDC003310 TaxID=3154447 RepID=UPI0033AAFF19